MNKRSLPVTKGMTAHLGLGEPAQACSTVLAILDERAKAYSYVRFSTKRQARGDSLQRQLERSRQYAAEHDLNLQEKSFEDLGVSAFDRSNVTKGALSAFIKAVESGAIERGSFLLVENLDRLSRADVLAAMGLLAHLVKLGIRIVTLVDRRVLDEETVKDPMNLMWAVMVFVRANEESETKSDRICRAHKRKRDNLSTFAFGQGPGWLRPNRTKTGWEIIPEKAASVVKVFEHVARGIGSTAIARIANREGWPVPGKAQDWHKTLPHKLIHNRRVLGEFEPQVKDGETRRRTGEYWENYYPAIVPVELFNAAQAAAENRRNLPKRRDSGYHNIFQGFLRCGHCGATLARKAKSSNRNSPGYAIYVCADRDRGLTTCPNWNARELETALIPPLMNCASAEILEGSAKKEALKSLENERAALNQAKKALQHLLSIVERTGASDTVAGRIRELEDILVSRRVRITELSAFANAPDSVVWEEDLEAAIADALRVVRDITDEMMSERAALHQSLSRVISKVWVWPSSHAAVQMHNDDTKILLQLSGQVPRAALVKGAFEVWTGPDTVELADVA
jgi:DNA invertase Pin-like site-specific DNA recombinase